MYHWPSVTLAEVVVDKTMGAPVLQEFHVKLLIVMLNSPELTDFARINLLQNSVFTKCSKRLGHIIHQICKKGISSLATTTTGESWQAFCTSWCELVSWAVPSFGSAGLSNGCSVPKA
jgi:hypothetical protein